MNRITRGGGRRGALRAAAATVALLVVGVVALVLGVRGSDGPPLPPAAAASQEPAAAPTPTSALPAPPSATTTSEGPVPGTAVAPNAAQPPSPSFGTFLPASAPTVLDIPSIGVHSSTFVDLQVASDGSLEVPGSANEVGFYTGGPTPGQLGPAVIGAHVDSTKGPGIFYRLGAVKPGAEVRITRQDGSVTSFVVDTVAVYPKDQFPSEQVYRGDFTRSEIRLVTCGGTFDKVKHYLDNVVVFGHLASAA